MDCRLERNGQKHAPRHPTNDDLFARRIVAAQALAHIEKSSREYARANGRYGAGRNADAAACAARRLANAGGAERRATAGSGGHVWRSQRKHCGEHDRLFCVVAPETAQSWNSRIGVWCDGWRQELARRDVSSRWRPQCPCHREDFRSREGVSNLVEWTSRTSWHQDQSGPQKARRPPIVVPTFGRATSLRRLDETCLERNRHDRDRRKISFKKVTSMASATRRSNCLA